MENQNFTFTKPYRPFKYQVLNPTAQVLDNLGLHLGKFTEEYLLEQAVAVTNLTDFGEDNFRESLHILVNSLHEEANLNLLGRQLMEKFLINKLANRLRIQNDLKNYPEIRQVPINKPLFIIGLPRTGTTLLHNLIAQDPSSRWLRLWEMAQPSPPPNFETFDQDSRPQAIQIAVNQYLKLAPQLPTVHNVDVNVPEECNSLFEHDLISIMFEIKANVKSYSQWLTRQDLTSSYRYYRQQLQLLSWHWAGDYWLLKAPFHLFHLENLLTVFPDACIIHNHRDPQKVLPSISSLTAIFRGIYSDIIDLSDIGKHFCQRFAEGITKAMKVRESANPQQFYDLHYQDLIRDPLGTVRNIYQYFGYEFTDTFQERLVNWINNNPQHKHGVHRYSLEQFSLKPETIQENFADYYEYFGINRENN